MLEDVFDIRKQVIIDIFYQIAAYIITKGIN